MHHKASSPQPQDLEPRRLNEPESANRDADVCQSSHTELIGPSDFRKEK